MKRLLSIQFATALALTVSLGAAQSTAPLADAAMRGDKTAIATLINGWWQVGLRRVAIHSGV